MAGVWKIGHRKWGGEKNPLPRTPTSSHPLQGVTQRLLKHNENINTNKTKPIVQSKVVDPLSSVLDGPDPLSDLLVTSDPLTTNTLFSNSQAVDDIKDDASNPSDIRHFTWEQCKTNILNNFTTSTTLTFTSSFLQPSDSGVVKTQTAITDRNRSQGMSGSERLRARLEQMDTLDEAGSGGTVREVGGLTQDEFSHRLNSLKLELKEAWNTDQRVKALKIAIQCVKLLSLSAPEHFYPSKFILVMEILDTFSNLVYQRLKHKFNTPGSPSSMGVNGSNEEAQETARNWFYKVASIRELLPRLYLETALLPCYSFFAPEEAEKALGRLSKMVRGLGDPLIAAYTRMFICRIGITIAPTHTNYIANTLEDFMFALKQGLWEEGEGDMNMGEDRDTLAARVFEPPLHWIMQCLATRASLNQLQKMVHECESGEGLGQNLLVGSILSTFPHSFIALQSLSLTQLIAQSYQPGCSQHKLLCALGICVNNSAPPQPQQLSLLNGVWKQITRISNTSNYLNTAAVWLEFTAKHFTSVEVNTLLGDVLKHISGEQDNYYYGTLLTLISTALTHSSDPHTLYSMNNFLGLLSVFQRDSIGVGSVIMRNVVTSLLQHHPQQLTDPILVQHLLTLSSALHDSINALTTDDERRQVSQLIISFVRQVNFGRDFEQQLDFYVNARAAFSNLDPVLIALIQCVCQLCVSTWLVMRGQHSGKTGAFVRACVAYCFITVPSLTIPTTRLRLYLITGSVALLNNCLAQGDACMKAAIREVVEVCGDADPGTTDSLHSLLTSLASTLIATPDPPDASPPLYLLRGLTNALRSQKQQLDADSYAMLGVALLHALSAAAQDDLPYHIHSVEGNDALYGGDVQVRQEAEVLCATLLEDILNHIKSLTGIHEKRCGHIVVSLFWCVVTWCDVTHKPTMSLITSLTSLIHKHSHPNIIRETKEWLRLRSKQLNDNSIAQLI